MLFYSVNIYGQKKNQDDTLIFVLVSILIIPDCSVYFGYKKVVVTENTRPICNHEMKTVGVTQLRIAVYK